MKTAIVALLIGAILLPLAGKVWVFADFYCHRAYIAKNLCENRNRPEMHCNGHCVLMLRLKKQEKRESRPLSESLKKGTELLLFVEKKETKSFHAPAPGNRLSVATNVDNCERDGVRSDIFYPPAGRVS